MRALVGATLAGVLLTGCALGADTATSDPTAPAPLPGAVAVASTTTAPSPRTVPVRPSRVGPKTAVPDVVPVQSADPAPPEPPVVAPKRLQMDSLGGVDMAVDVVGVESDGQMEVPDDADRAGWYEFGPTVGEPTGTAVIVAHSGSYITPRGPIAELHELDTGDSIDVTRTDGRTVEYEVTDVASLDKTTIDFDSYFRRDGDPRLVVITCGGDWDEEARSYDQNVVATARLARE